MDLVNILLYCFMSCAIGAVLMLLIQYYAFVRYFNVPAVDDDDEQQKKENEKYVLPDNLLLNLKTPDAESKNTLMAINLILQFLYFELRHSNAVRKWFYRKLSLELDELLLKTTTGKFFDKLTIRELDLGSQFPEIKNLKVHHADLNENEGHIENLDLLLDLYYKGNFRLAIDADMVLGKKGFLSVKVKHISGLARLQFTRKPYTHWSLSFVGDPQLDLGIETQFQGRQVQSNVTTLISNQIRKAIRRKHTLPNYKLRYKPFFNRPDDEVDTTDIIPNGTLDVQITELTRLVIPKSVTSIFCTVTLASVAWVRARQHGDGVLKISLDLEIHKAKNQQIGIVFKQLDTSVIVESIIPYSPASKAKMRPGDILVSIEGKKLSHINNVAKIVKNLSSPVFMLRIERTIKGVIKSTSSPLENLELTQDISSDMNIQYTKSSENVKISSPGSTTVVLKRSNSADRTPEGAKRSDSSESSQPNTPSHSPRKITDKPAGSTGRLKSFSRNNSDTKVLDEIDEDHPLEDLETTFPECVTADAEASAFVHMDHSFNFELREVLQYVNINVFGKKGAGAKEQQLLGYLNLPLTLVLAECAESNLGHFLKRYPLNPPDTPDFSNHHLSAQSGFDPNLCYGDILLAFVWNENLSATTEVIKKRKLSEKLLFQKSTGEKEDANVPKTHDFIRTHFHRATQCDFCGKKIWLKDAVQCRNCVMCCHKKCITKCQNATVCLPSDGSSQSTQQVEFKLTEAPDIDDGEIDDTDENDEQLRPKLEVHRQSFSDLLAQGLKRVNSANNLALPMGVLGHCSKSLPPSPQHTPRKQSLVNQSHNPFVLVTHLLEQIPDDVKEIDREQIVELTEPLVDWGSPDDLMGLAKASSKSLFVELEPAERLDKINKQLSKIHVAMNSESLCQTSLQASPAKDTAKQPGKQPPPPKLPSASNTNNSLFGADMVLQTKAPATAIKDTTMKSLSTALDKNEQLTPDQQQMATARKALLIGESEARLQTLSVIMLYLCNGLQQAQMAMNE